MKKKEKPITFEMVANKVLYEPISGAFSWVDASTLRPCAMVSKTGYAYIYMFRTGFCAHRVAWLLSNGKWPECQIDHINGNRADNRLTNLRDVSNMMNSQNRLRPQIDNSTGFLGVCPLGKGGKGFRAQIKVRGVKIHLGTFPTPEKAYAAYVDAKRELHDGCTL